MFKKLAGLPRPQNLTVRTQSSLSIKTNIMYGYIVLSSQARLFMSKQKTMERQEEQSPSKSDVVADFHFIKALTQHKEYFWEIWDWTLK